MTASRPNNEAIFHTARAIPDLDRRRAYVREACGGDDIRIAHIEALLAAADTPDSLLDRPAGSDSVATIDQPTAESTGAVIGPYKLLEQSGEGGMGTVWMAQQTEPVKRLVALKLIKAGMASKQVITRFEAERQALALMDHPNIAKVLDGGTTDAGRPYFVMDLVKGVPITRYCDEHHLTPRQRLELFIPVCQAVQHAHQKGIIHRDLKPSNVLVALYDGRPVPKVIDFGVAKAAGQPLTEQTLVTGFGAIVGTLEYMSPEQAEVNQLDIDTRSDVYSLGVLLYELLTGSPPFSRKELEKAGMLEMLRVIREQEPSKPSTKLSTAEGLPTLAANRSTEPAKLTRLVRGELDWIVMKALEKDRNRRYETANGFAMDVQRYLTDEAVLACPPSVGYRLRKLVRRHKVAFTMASFIFLALFILIGSIGWNIRDRAMRQAVIAAEANRALDEVQRLQEQNKWSQALAIIKQAQSLVQSGTGAEESLQARVRDRVKDLEMAVRLEQLFQTHQPRISGADGNKMLPVDNDYTKAFVEYGIDVDRLDPAEAARRLNATSVRLELILAMDIWARVRRIRNPFGDGWIRVQAVNEAADGDKWRSAYRGAWNSENAPGIRRSLEALTRSTPLDELHPQTIVLIALGLRDMGHGEQAITFLEKARRRHTSDFWIVQELAWMLDHASFPESEKALRFYTASIALQPNNVATHFDLADSLSRRGQLDEAIAEYRETIRLQPQSIVARISLGDILARQGRVDEANAAYDEAFSYMKQAIAHKGGDVSAHNNLAWLLATWPDDKFRDIPQAAARAKKAIDLAPNDMFAWQILGIAHYRAGNWKPAVAALRKSLELSDEDRGTLHDRDRNICTYFFLAMAHHQLGERGQTRALYERANEWLEARVRALGQNRQREELKRFRAEARELLGIQDNVKSKED